MPNPVVAWQILSPNPEATARFYNKLFDWQVDADNGLGYRQFRTGSAFEGGVWPMPQDERSFCQLFIQVDDVEQAITRAVALGANVLVPASALPDGDVMAVLQDPSGLSFGLVKAK